MQGQLSKIKSVLSPLQSCEKPAWTLEKPKVIRSRWKNKMRMSWKVIPELQLQTETIKHLKIASSLDVLVFVEHKEVG